MRGLTVLLVALAFASPPGLSEAQAPDAEESQDSPGDPENAESAQSARDHFNQGMTHFGARHFRRAIEQFTLAAALVPSADLWFNIARSHEELDEHAQAAEFYRRYLRDRVDPPDRERVEARIVQLMERAEAARLALQNRPTTGSIRVSANVEGAAVAIDEQAVGETPVPESTEMAPGEHSLTLERPGFVPFRAQVQVDAGLTTGAYADLQPRTEYRSIRGRRVVTWIAAALVGVGVATSIGFGVRARSSRNDGFDAPPGEVRDDLLDEARRRARFSDIALGGSLAMAVIGVILYFVEGRSIGTEQVSGPERPVPAATASVRPGAYAPLL